MKPDRNLTGPVPRYMTASSGHRKNPPFPAGFGGADEGTRTLDLLHGKENAVGDRR